MAKKYQIWVEGFKNGDVHAKATMLGEVIADNFDEACESLKEQDEIFAKYLYKVRGKPFRFWGCRVYSSEEKARRSFG